MPLMPVMVYGCLASLLNSTAAGKTSPLLMSTVPPAAVLLSNCTMSLGWKFVVPPLNVQLPGAGSVSVAFHSVEGLPVQITGVTATFTSMVARIVHQTAVASVAPRGVLCTVPRVKAANRCRRLRRSIGSA